jgi:hypothetical protein
MSSCVDVTLTMVTKSFGSENSWHIQPGECSGSDYSNHRSVATSCCLPAGEYELNCLDSYSDGWHGGYLEIDGAKYCESFAQGHSQVETVVVGGGSVPTTTTAPVTTATSTQAPATTTTPTTAAPTANIVTLAATPIWVAEAWSVCAEGGSTAADCNAGCMRSRTVRCVSALTNTASTDCSENTKLHGEEMCACPLAEACKDQCSPGVMRGATVLSCTDLSDYCYDQTHGTTVRERCPLTCGQCEFQN